MYLSIIIPCYNEETRIGKTLEAVHAYLKKQSYTWEIIVVDNGEMEGTGKALWDIDAFVKEHCAFPLAPKKDRVDSATGGFNAIIKNPRRAGMRILSPRLTKGKFPFHLLAVSREELARTNVAEPAILIDVIDPGEPSNGQPVHGCDRLLDWCRVEFADVDPAAVQDRWTEVLQPWGKTPAELVIGREAAKKIWSLVTKKRAEPPKVVVVADAGDRRAWSVVKAIGGLMNVPEEATACGDNRIVEVNPHVVAQVKLGRALVM